ncbi:aspartic peptidase A1 [Mycena galericulata]|nr:aspartic peptidase A1 [Mycena galericulata]
MKAMSKLYALLFILFVLFKQCPALPRPEAESSQIQPFISLPLVKLHPSSPLNALDTIAVHRKHVRRATRRLAFMSGAQSLRPSESQDTTTSRNSVDTETVARSLKSTSDSELTKAHPTAYPESAPLEIEADDIGYLTNILLGTPPQSFRMLVDSGSADMWVGGEGCEGDSGGNCGNHKFLGESSSSSFRDTGKPWYIGYGTGSVSGTLVKDSVQFVGLTLKNHTFGVARNESADFTPNEIPLDGVLGCAKESLSGQKTPTLVKALKNAGLLAKNVISYKIPRKSDGKNDGEITLGGMDPSKYDPSTLVRVKNVNTGGFWEGPLDAVKVNGKEVGLVGKSCIFDTGTTLLAAPKEDVDAIHHHIPGAKYSNSTKAWTLPCSTNASVSLGFGGKHFPIRPGDLTFLPVDPKNTTGACTSAIIVGGVSEGSTNWLVGDTFLKNVYLSTDEDDDIIHLARLKWS